MLYLPWCGAGPPRWVGKRVGGSPWCGLGATVVTRLVWMFGPGHPDQAADRPGWIRLDGGGGRKGWSWLAAGDPLLGRHRTTPHRPGLSTQGGLSAVGGGLPPHLGARWWLQASAGPPGTFPLSPFPVFLPSASVGVACSKGPPGLLEPQRRGGPPRGLVSFPCSASRHQDGGARQWWRFLAQWGPFSGSGTGG